MSVEGKHDGKATGAVADPFHTASEALAALLATTKTQRPPSQVQLARHLRKPIAQLKARGVSLEEIHTHLKKAGITISKNALGEALKKRPRRSSSAPSSDASATSTAS